MPTSTPARHYNRSAAGPGEEFDRESGERLPDVPSLYEAERRLMLYDGRLADRVQQYDNVLRAAAEAKADWEEHRDRCIVGYAANDGARSSADKRLAQAKLAMSVRNVPGEDLYRAHLITAAAADSCKASISALQSQLSSLQTLIRGLRQVTGFQS